jgi:hypothetical protein
LPVTSTSFTFSTSISLFSGIVTKNSTSVFASKSVGSSSPSTKVTPAGKITLTLTFLNSTSIVKPTITIIVILLSTTSAAFSSPPINNDSNSWLAGGVINNSTSVPTSKLSAERLSSTKVTPSGNVRLVVSTPIVL